MNLVKKYIHDWRSILAFAIIGLGKSSIPEVNEASAWLILSFHLNKKELSSVWVVMNQLYHFLSLFQYYLGKFYWVNLFDLRRYYKGKMRVGGLPSLISFSMNLGQLQSYYLYFPLFCYLGIHPLLIIVSSQLFIIFNVSFSSFLTVT
jgi:hypothetical protein